MFKETIIVGPTELSDGTGWTYGRFVLLASAQWRLHLNLVSVWWRVILPTGKYTCKWCMLPAIRMEGVGSLGWDHSGFSMLREETQAYVVCPTPLCGFLLLFQCCLTSTDTMRLIRDGEPRTAASTFTQLRLVCPTSSPFLTHTAKNADSRVE